MAYFGRKPDKPGSVPGSQSGGKEEKQARRLRGEIDRIEKAVGSGRVARAVRMNRALRNARSQR